MITEPARGQSLQDDEPGRAGRSQDPGSGALLSSNAPTPIDPSITSESDLR